MTGRQAWNQDHGRNPAIARKRKALDHLIVGDDLIGARRKQAIDAPEPERMLEMDHFPSRAQGHHKGPVLLRVALMFSDIPHRARYQAN
jgi:hypothetical protein